MASPIDRMFLRVAKIQTFAGGQPLTNATGFFYLHDGFLYLVTARHVVTNPWTGHRPDRIQVSLHSAEGDLRHNSDITIPLYMNRVPQWRLHPQLDDAADVAAIAINDPHVLSSHFVSTFCQADVLTADHAVPLGQEVLILGFPLGFHDTIHNLPIVRSATIASSFLHPFQGRPYFLTDARLHRGMSGSPVIARITRHVDDDRSPEWRLLGIHSSAMDVSDRDPAQDERLALNVSWYASLIPDMFRCPDDLDQGEYD